MCACINVYVYVCVFTYVCMCVCVYVCLSVEGREGVMKQSLKKAVNLLISEIILTTRCLL